MSTCSASAPPHSTTNTNGRLVCTPCNCDNTHRSSTRHLKSHARESAFLFTWAAVSSAPLVTLPVCDESSALTACYSGVPSQRVSLRRILPTKLILTPMTHSYAPLERLLLPNGFFFIWPVPFLKACPDTLSSACVGVMVEHNECELLRR
jgi:hypothetical protein